MEPSIDLESDYPDRDLEADLLGMVWLRLEMALGFVVLVILVARHAVLKEGRRKAAHSFQAWCERLLLGTHRDLVSMRRDCTSRLVRGGMAVLEISEATPQGPWH